MAKAQKVRQLNAPFLCSAVPWILECCCSCVVIHIILDTFVIETHFPALWQRGFFSNIPVPRHKHISLVYTAALDSSYFEMSQMIINEQLKTINNSAFYDKHFKYKLLPLTKFHKQLCHMPCAKT